MKKLLRYLAIALLLAIIGGCIYLNSLMPIITGYAAKNLASAVFVSGREAKAVEALDRTFPSFASPVTRWTMRTRLSPVACFGANLQPSIARATV